VVTTAVKLIGSSVSSFKSISHLSSGIGISSRSIYVAYVHTQVHHVQVIGFTRSGRHSLQRTDKDSAKPPSSAELVSKAEFALAPAEHLALQWSTDRRIQRRHPASRNARCSWDQLITSPKMATFPQQGGYIMRQIQLTQNKVAILDDEDFVRLGHFHWCYRGERDRKLGYAIRHARENRKTRTVYLHREIMGEVPPGHEVIFLNHDKLDCRRANLKVVNKDEARRHHRVRSDSKTGSKGVRFNAEGQTWSAYVYRHDQIYHIGTYYSKEAAEQAYQNALRRENPDLHSAPAVVERQAEPREVGGFVADVA
jgi:hypothetical protein